MGLSPLFFVRAKEENEEKLYVERLRSRTCERRFMMSRERLFYVGNCRMVVNYESI